MTPAPCNRKPHRQLLNRSGCQLDPEWNDTRLVGEPITKRGKLIVVNEGSITLHQFELKLLGVLLVTSGS